uniref:SFRICE_023009 n=1 Tax=Spodoptera frugiperda TaxID=7108 RepID=A0A2H1V4A3_SPOFR
MGPPQNYLLLNKKRILKIRRQLTEYSMNKHTKKKKKKTYKQPNIVPPPFCEVETHTTASTDPHRTDRIIGNAYMRYVLNHRILFIILSMEH